MNTALWTENITAHWIQAAILVTAGAGLPALLGLRSPRPMLRYWQALLTACLLLPFAQPWLPRAAPRSVVGAVQPASVNVVMLDAGSMLSLTDIALAVIAAGIVLRLAWFCFGAMESPSLPATSFASRYSVFAFRQGAFRQGADGIAAAAGGLSFQTSLRTGYVRFPASCRPAAGQPFGNAARAAAGGAPARGPARGARGLAIHGGRGTLSLAVVVSSRRLVGDRAGSAGSRAGC